MTDWEVIRRRMADTSWRDEVEAEVLGDGVGWSTALDDLARQQVAAGWLPGTLLQITTLDAEGRTIGYRETTIRELVRRA